MASVLLLLLPQPRGKRVPVRRDFHLHIRPPWDLAVRRRSGDTVHGDSREISEGPAT